MLLDNLCINSISLFGETQMENKNIIVILIVTDACQGTNKNQSNKQ